jgi:hypothetical protein
MDQSELFRLYGELQDYVNWQDDDVARLESLKPLVRPSFENIADSFYEKIARHPSALQVLTGGEPQIVDSPTWDHCAIDRTGSNLASCSLQASFLEANDRSRGRLFRLRNERGGRPKSTPLRIRRRIE